MPLERTPERSRRVAIGEFILAIVLVVVAAVTGIWFAYIVAAVVLLFAVLFGCGPVRSSMVAAVKAHPDPARATGDLPPGHPPQTGTAARRSPSPSCPGPATSPGGGPVAIHSPPAGQATGHQRPGRCRCPFRALIGRDHIRQRGSGRGCERHPAPRADLGEGHDIELAGESHSDKYAVISIDVRYDFNGAAQVRGVDPAAATRAAGGGEHEGQR